MFVSRLTIRELSCLAKAVMSSDEEEALSPELGASSSKSPVQPLSDNDYESDQHEESADERPMKKRGHKKDVLEWKELAQYQKADHEPEEIEHKIFEECKRLMEVTRWFRIDSKPALEHDIFLWKHSTFWSVGKGSVDYQMLYCPTKRRFKCDCQIKICRTSQYVSLEMHGTNHDDADSHSVTCTREYTSKF